MPTAPDTGFGIRPAGHRHIAILGLMGVGKTTTADALAAALGLPHRDSDADITARTGGSGKELAATHGIAHLHRLEAEVLLDALRAPDRSVISAAGSVVENPTCRRALLAGATVFVLWVPSDELTVRITTGGHRRPMSRDEIEDVAQRRAPLFAELADATFDATAPTDELVAAMVEHLRSGPLHEPSDSTGFIEED